MRKRSPIFSFQSKVAMSLSSLAMAARQAGKSITTMNTILPAPLGRWARARPDLAWPGKRDLLGLTRQGAIADRLSAVGANWILGRRVLATSIRNYYGDGFGHDGNETRCYSLFALKLASLTTRLGPGHTSTIPAEWLILATEYDAYLTIDDAIVSRHFAGQGLLRKKIVDVQTRGDWINIAIGDHVLELPAGGLNRGTALDAWVRVPALDVVLDGVWKPKSKRGKRSKK